MKAKTYSLLALFLLIPACSGRTISHEHVKRTGGPESLVPTRTGMTLESAYAAIGGSGEFIPNADRSGYNLSYYYKLGNYRYQVFNGISPDRKITSVIMTFTAAYESAESASECSDFFGTAVSGLKQKFGEPDFAPRVHTENGKIVSKAIFTFSDSSSVRADYSYPQNVVGTHNCIINIYSAQPWAEEHNNGWSPSAPMMRTPWSRFK